MCDVGILLRYEVGLVLVYYKISWYKFQPFQHISDVKCGLPHFALLPHFAGKQSELTTFILTHWFHTSMAVTGRRLGYMALIVAILNLLPESAVNNPWDTIRKIGSFVRTLSLIITPGGCIRKN